MKYFISLWWTYNVVRKPVGSIIKEIRNCVSIKWFLFKYFSKIQELQINHTIKSKSHFLKYYQLILYRKIKYSKLNDNYKLSMTRTTFKKIYLEIDLCLFQAKNRWENCYLYKSLLQILMTLIISKKSLIS